MKRRWSLPERLMVLPAVLLVLATAALMVHTPSPSVPRPSTTAPSAGPVTAVSGVPAPPASPAEVELEATLAGRYDNLRRVGDNTWEGTDRQGRGVLITRRR